MSRSLNEKIAGALYGLAIGDALGLGGEFMSRDEVAVRYPEGLRNYEDIYQDMHRSQWESGEWTNDTEMTLAIVECVLERGGYNPEDIAHALKRWYKGNPKDMVSILRGVLGDAEYEEAPEEVARQVWNDMGGNEASNEANPCSPFVGWAKDNHRELGAKVCRLTHADPRSVGANVVLAEMSHDIFWNDRVTDAETLIDIAVKIDGRVEPFIRLAQNDTLDALNLDDAETYWYARKTMAAALWCVWKNLSPMEAFDAILSAGGDTNTNACVALFLLGMISGPEGFPEHLRNGLAEKERLERIAGALTEHFIKLGYRERQ